MNNLRQIITHDHADGGHELSISLEEGGPSLHICVREGGEITSTSLSVEETQILMEALYGLI